jgi:dimethylamine monooxygenase subunit C
MTIQGIKSRPVYRPLALDPSGRRHLLVTDGPAFPKDAFDGDGPEAFTTRWTVSGTSTAIPAPDVAAPDAAFRSSQHLFIALRRRLAEEHMGLRLYAAGTEPFIWEVYGLASGAGLQRDELFLYACGSAARRVFCNHCRTITGGVTTNIATCAGCGAKLFVRDHFSRRLNAFAGVQVDAEAPGDSPPLEEIYR